MKKTEIIPLIQRVPDCLYISDDSLTINGLPRIWYRPFIASSLLPETPQVEGDIWVILEDKTF